MIVFPNAKINLGLRIIAKRPDGFHDLETGFYPVGWCDALEIIEAETTSFSSSGLPIPGTPETNLCLRAYTLLQADFALPPVQIHLLKNIPIGAGLGGGSADAAYTLRLLNEQFGLGLNPNRLEAYARQLGSDCAFFVRNEPAFGTEKGDVLEPLSLDLSGFYALLIYPNLPISTAEAYAGVRPNANGPSLREGLAQPMVDWRETVVNDFEAGLFPNYPLLAKLKHQLYEMGAVYASLSGSGSTIFGLFNAPPAPNQFGGYRVWQGRL